MMREADKKKWVVALLSGEYEQGRSWLELNGRYCCLGVLCKINGLPTKDDDGCAKTMPDSEQLEQFGLDGTVADRLAELNDVGVPFDMIAALIDDAL